MGFGLKILHLKGRLVGPNILPQAQFHEFRPNIALPYGYI